jgi:anti-sigma factor RsiW
MNCGDVREILFAFLDNELDASLSIEVQRHMEHCPDCAREAETERAVGKRLAAAMERESAGLPALDEIVGTAVAGPAIGHRRRRVGKGAWRGLGVAAVVFLGVAGWWYVASDRRPGGGGLVDALVADFDHFVSGGRPVQIASADPGEVSRWLASETGLAVTLPATKGHCKLIGARKCKLNGQTAALASYEMESTPTCLVVLASGPGALGDMRRVTQDGRSFWLDRRKHHTVVACQREELIYAAVSTLEGADLLHFLSELE